MTKIAVCICTRRREKGLKRLLVSIENMIIPTGVELSVIVVENDRENYSEQLVLDHIASSKLDIRYFLETKQGLSYARNKSVREAAGSDFCSFIDDDQVVATDWLVELVKCQREFNADGVWGSNPPIFNDEVPAYVRKFYEPDRYAYGTIVKKAFTNSLLLRKSILDKLSGPFDPRMNFSGGEDSLMTSLFSAIGGVIRYNPNAIAYEVVPKNRTTIKYMVKRTFRISNTELCVRSIIERGFRKVAVLPRLFLRFVYGLLLSLPCLLFAGEEKLKGLIKLTNAVGGFFFVAGKQNQFYK
jgi:succinoglycan biosynthesis protein ExoM